MSNIPKGYKQTEVGVIPGDWGVKKLGDYVKITSGESPSKFRFKSNGVPYFKVEQLNNSSKYQNETPYYIETNNIVLKGSIIFPKRGASIFLNKIRILEEDSFMDTNLMTLSISEELSNEYLFYILTHYELWRIADTTSIPQINNKHITPFLIPLPPTKAEQRVIATALSDADALITSLEKLISKKRNIKQGAMQELLSYKKRLPGFSGKWEMKKLGEIVEIKKGQLITEKTCIPGNIPVIAGGKTPAYFHNRSNRLKKTITISASGASAGYVSFHSYPMFASDCSTIEEGLNYSVEFIFFKLQLVQEKIYKMQTGGAQPHIHPSDLCPIEFSIPKKEEQTAIAKTLSDMDAEIEQLEQKLDKFKMIKQGMMQELLTGKTRLI
jgi:type I restriction enzyme S subunit